MIADLPFVPSAVRLGTARGPRLALLVHVAEGGGTVGYLSRPNRNGVSVHFVIERSGRIVRMLDLDEMHSSLRVSAIRTTNDPPFTVLGETVVYGASAARAVLGKWADTRTSLGPNHATLAVEIEGFAADGPRPAQASALVRLVTALREHYPDLRVLAHRDFAAYKRCPGWRIDWPALGGHGAGTSLTFTASATTTTTASAAETVTINPFAVRRFRTRDGLTVLRRFSAIAELTPIPAPYSATVDAEVSFSRSSAPSGSGFLRLASGGSAGRFVLAAEVVLDESTE